MKRVTIAVVAALALAGCGGSTRPTQTVTVQTATPSTTTTPTTTTVTTTAHTVTSQEHTTTVVTDPPPPALSSGSCGSGLQVNSATSCPFAQNVQSAYYSQVGSGGGTVIAYSPTTGKTYAMSCTTGEGVVCTGGTNAYVAW